MPKIAVYPGSFDPITNGHVDVIKRAAEMFDEVIVLIGVNTKKTTLFTDEERYLLATESLKDISNVSVESFKGLTVEHAKLRNACAIIRGVRAVSDFEYEFQLALMNRKLMPDIHTVFMMPHEKYTYLNSTIVRELAFYHKDTTEFVSDIVSEKLKEKFENKTK